MIGTPSPEHMASKFIGTRSMVLPHYMRCQNISRAHNRCKRCPRSKCVTGQFTSMWYVAT